jgi:hypothetical protein
VVLATQQPLVRVVEVAEQAETELMALTLRSLLLQQQAVVLVQAQMAHQVEMAALAALAVVALVDKRLVYMRVVQAQAVKATTAVTLRLT